MPSKNFGQTFYKIIDFPDYLLSVLLSIGDNRYSLGNVIKGGAVRSVMGESVGMNPRDAGNLTGPRAASYVADHENLQVKP